MGVYIRNITKEQFVEDCNEMGVLVITEGISEIDLVRCGECKWWDKDGESPYGYCHAEKHCHFSSNWEISIYRKYKADHYCSDGERRE